MKGCIKFNDLEILAYDDEIVDFDAQKFVDERVDLVL